MVRQKIIIIYVTVFIIMIFPSCSNNKNLLNGESFMIPLSADTRWPLFGINGMTHHVVFKKEGKYACFPSLAIDPLNDHLYTEFTVKDIATHYELPNDRKVCMESRDGGITWQVIEVLPSHVRFSRPGLIVVEESSDKIQFMKGTFKTPNGDLVRIGHNWRRWLPIDSLSVYENKYLINYSSGTRGPGPNFFSYTSGGFLECSEDLGKTWQRTDIPELDLYESGSSPWSYDQLPDGTVIRAFAIRKSIEEPHLSSVVVVLTRNGRTAQVVNVIGNKAGYGFNWENLIHVTSTGIIWMLIRMHDHDPKRNNNNLWQAISEDGGWSWTAKPTVINIGRSPVSGLVQLDKKRLLLVAGNRVSPYGIHALVSEDEGLTWRHDMRIALRQDGHGFDLGYPNALKLKDNTVVAIYYYSTAEEVSTEGYSTRSIIATRFKVPSMTN